MPVRWDLMPSSKSQAITNASMDVEKRKPLVHCGRTVKMVQPL